jgi:hypothetical protein
VPTSANTNGCVVSKDRKSLAEGLPPASYATVHPPLELPVSSFSAEESEESLILCQL